jgi:acyl CoA:acetate/3-ketoacid CoA transferase beta subunit
MSNVAPANPLEMLAYNLSLLIEDGQIVYVGTGLPMVGAMLAHKTHAKNITMVFESGGQDPTEGCDRLAPAKECIYIPDLTPEIHKDKDSWKPLK